MSVVYRAEDLALGRKVALKLLAPELAENKHFRARFQRESRLAASIDHAHIVPVYEAGEAEGRLFIAMRYVEGTDLKELLQDEGPLSPERTLALCGQVADALDAAHERGLIHRDIKASNVLVTVESGKEHCYLGDFGLTKSASERDGGLEAEQIEGTGDYLAPEVIEGGRVEESADVYGLGCLLYECVTGEAPFRRGSWLSTLWAQVHDPPPKPSELDLGLPAEFDEVVATALAKDPAERYVSAGELQEAAAAALIPAPTTSRRRWAIAAAAVLLAAVLAAVLAVVFTGGESAPDTTPTTEITTESIQHVDPETNELAATIEAPGVLQIAAGGGFVWAANAEENRISRIDPDSHRIVQTLEGVGNPELLAFGGGALWALDPVDRIVTRIDPDTGEVAGSIPLPPGAMNGALGASMRASEHGVWLAWSTPDGNAVHIDPQSRRARVVQIGPESVYETIDFAQVDDSTVWVLGSSWTGEIALHKIDPNDPASARAVATTDYGRLAAHAGSVWVIAPILNRVDRFDATTGQSGDGYQVGTYPTGGAGGGDAMWVVSQGDGALIRIDLDSREVSAPIEVGPNPASLSVSEDGIWVAVRPDDPS